MIEKIRAFVIGGKLLAWTFVVVRPKQMLRAFNQENPAEIDRGWHLLNDRVKELVLELDDRIPLSNSAALKIHHELVRSGFKNL